MSDAADIELFRDVWDEWHPLGGNTAYWCWVYPKRRHEFLIIRARRTEQAKIPGKKTGSYRVKHWEIIADNLSKAGWTLGCVSPPTPRSLREGHLFSLALELLGNN